MNDNYIRATRTTRCPICRKPDWCLIARDGSAAICPRTPEGGKWLGEAGFLHKLTDAEPAQFSSTRNVYVAPRADFKADEAAEAMQAVVKNDDTGLVEYASQLGLSADSLHALGIGYLRRESAFSFPMKDHKENVIGIRLRGWDGRKWAVNGSRSGLFIGPRRSGTLYIGEGPTDTAALIDLDRWALGRPSCMGGTVETIKYVQKHRPSAVVIVSDRDGPGVVGAENLADALWSHVPAVRIIEPLVGKDIRQWRIQGCTPRQLEQVVLNSVQWSRRAA